MLPLHHGPVKRTTRIERVSPEWRPGALPPELRPRSSAGGIRTHGLELMRLARTAAPLPRVAFEVWLAVPPAGLEPAASGLRARRHRRFDHGGVKLRRQASNLPLAINSRA